MPLPKLYPESVLGRFARGTLDGIEAVLEVGQTRADFIRAAVEEKIARAQAIDEVPGRGVEPPAAAVAETTRQHTIGLNERSRPIEAWTAEVDFCAGLDQVTRRVLGHGAAPNDLGAMLIRMGLELMRPLDGTSDQERLMARALKAARADPPSDDA